MELRMPTPEQLRAAYYTDLKAAFPPAELKPLRSIREGWRTGRYRPWCLFDGETVAGECFLWLGRPGWQLIDYLCIPAARRNRGLGSLMLSLIREKEPGQILLLESEETADAPDPAMAARRLDFYARNGAKLAGYDTEIFGVHYKSLYWADRPVSDGELMEAHRFIYQSGFSPAKFHKYIRIPRDPAAGQGARVPWDE